MDFFSTTGSWLIYLTYTALAVVKMYRVFHKILYHLRCKFGRNYMIKVNETKQD